MSTDEGDEFIRAHIRWDDEARGYRVTLYTDGRAEEVLVTQIYAKGARDDAQDSPSIATLYEAAFAQKYGTEYLDSGFHAEAMRRITGSDVKSTGGWWIFGTSVDDARRSLEDGGQAVISSPRNDGAQSRDLTVRDANGSESTAEVRFVDKHSYTVTDIDSEGAVWILNPWGPGNSFDGGREVRVPPDLVDEIFGDVSFTNVTR